MTGLLRDTDVIGQFSPPTLARDVGQSRFLVHCVLPLQTDRLTDGSACTGPYFQFWRPMYFSA